MKFRALSALFAAILFPAAGLLAQTDAPAPTPEAAATAKEPLAGAPAAPRPPEGSRIINLPSADAPRRGTLTVLFTHRFSQPVEQSDIHSLYSFDSGADIGIGLAYAPIDNLDVSLYRSSGLDVYELDVKYHVLTAGPLSAAVRLGGDWRTEANLQNRNGIFAQAILGLSLGSRVRLTAVPTYVSKTSGQRFVSPKPFYENLFNVPAAVSIAVTRSINVQGEVEPRLGKADSRGVAWIAAIEKTVVRHRFAFTVGNQRGTTVDQYIATDFSGLPSHGYYLGFNLVRQWKL
ncbi:MAG: DUF5777 family beta-barrel protein [Acidobacteriota bacterium]